MMLAFTFATHSYAYISNSRTELLRRQELQKYITCHFNTLYYITLHYTAIAFVFHSIALHRIISRYIHYMTSRHATLRHVMETDEHCRSMIVELSNELTTFEAFDILDKWQFGVNSVLFHFRVNFKDILVRFNGSSMKTRATPRATTRVSCDESREIC